MVYISHRLSEVKQLADRVVVLRDGANAGELARNQITHDSMVRMMVGRDISEYYQRQSHQPGDPVLQVQDLCTPEYPRHRVSFTLRAGEIVGLAGLVGAGRSELLHAIFGVSRPVAGSVRVAHKQVDIKEPRDAVDAGMALVPEDRKTNGLILEMGVNDNLTLAGLGRNKRAGAFLNRAYERAVSRDMIAQLSIKTPSPAQLVQYLSGGNQQKVVLGKWLALNPRVLLLDEPTRGIDVGAKEEIYRMMERLAQQGVAILFVSSEMEEILGMSDRTLVMHQGRMTGELSRGELNEEAVMQLATGRV